MDKQDFSNLFQPLDSFILVSTFYHWANVFIVQTHYFANSTALSAKTKCYLFSPPRRLTHTTLDQNMHPHANSQCFSSSSNSIIPLPRAKKVRKIDLGAIPGSVIYQLYDLGQVTDLSKPQSETM